MESFLANGRNEKYNNLSLRRRNHYLKLQGHRLTYTEIRIEAITA